MESSIEKAFMSIDVRLATKSQFPLTNAANKFAHKHWKWILTVGGLVRCFWNVNARNSNCMNEDQIANRLDQHLMRLKHLIRTQEQ